MYNYKGVKFFVCVHIISELTNLYQIVNGGQDSSLRLIYLLSTIVNSGRSLSTFGNLCYFPLIFYYVC